MGSENFIMCLLTIFQIQMISMVSVVASPSRVMQLSRVWPSLWWMTVSERLSQSASLSVWWGQQEQT